MRRILDILRATFISIEFLFLFGVVVLSERKPEFFVYIGSIIKGNSDIAKWTPIVPIALCAYAIQSAWKLTTPLSGSNRVLFDWPDYWKLKYRRNLSIVLSFLAAAAATSNWIFSYSLNNYWTGICTTSSLMIALINVGCMTFATFEIREIIEP